MSKVIMISAKQGGGKTTLANELLKQLPDATIVKFAQPLYDILKLVKLEILKIDLLTRFDPESTRSVLYYNTMHQVYLFLEKFGISITDAGSNPEIKDQTLLKILKKYYKSADLLNLSIDKITDADGVFFQDFAESFGRQLIDKDIWCRIADSYVSKLKTEHIIFDDLRHKNEFATFPSALKVRLDCKESLRLERCAKRRDNTNHISEIDLDDYADQKMFDLYFNTEFESTELIAKKIIETVI